MESLFEELGGTYHQEGITSCPICLCLKPLPLAPGGNGGDIT